MKEYPASAQQPVLPPSVIKIDKIYYGGLIAISTIMIPAFFSRMASLS